MGHLKSIAIEHAGTRDLALIDGADAVWLVIPLRWWDLATLFFWLLLPADRKAKVKMTIRDAERDTTNTVSMFAVRVASRHARVRGTIKT